MCVMRLRDIRSSRITRSAFVSFSNAHGFKGGGCNTVHEHFVIRLYALIFVNVSTRVMIIKKEQRILLHNLAVDKREIGCHRRKHEEKKIPSCGGSGELFSWNRG